MGSRIKILNTDISDNKTTVTFDATKMHKEIASALTSWEKSMDDFIDAVAAINKVITIVEKIITVNITLKDIDTNETEV